MSRQARDSIVYNDQACTVSFVKLKKEDDSGPLSPLYTLKEKLGVDLSPINLRSNNYRGFTCGWEIIDDALYLKRFSSLSYRIYTFDQFLGLTPPDDENVNGDKNLFPPDEVHHFAEWFNGVIVAYHGRAKQEDELNGWEMEFENGRLIKVTPRFVAAPIRLKDLIEDDEDSEAKETDNINGCQVF